MKLMQICASHNDLFGLADDGRVYQYNFSTNAWIKLARRRQERTAAFSDGVAKQGQPEAAKGHNGHGAAR
jgi:hypothetical protein